MGESLPTGLVRGLLRMERSDVLEAPYSPEQLQDAIKGLMAEPASAPSGPSGCWAVSGAVGGAGATTIAIEVATALAARAGKARSVCMVDLNLADGAAAAYLGVSPTLRLEDFAQTANRIDASILPAFVTSVSKQLDLIASVRDPNAFDGVPRDVMLRILEVACERYDWVILDLHRHRRAWTVEVLSGCDEILIASELTVPALLAARTYAEEIESAISTDLKARFVLNRVANRMFGPAPSMSEAERALQRKAEAGVPSDWEAASASVNLGGSISRHRPKSKIVKEIRALVERLATHATRSDSEPARTLRAA